MKLRKLGLFEKRGERDDSKIRRRVTRSIPIEVFNPEQAILGSPPEGPFIDDAVHPEHLVEVQ